MKSIWVKYAVGIMFFGLLGIGWTSEWQAPGKALMPGTEIFTAPVSEARWLWFQAPRVETNVDAYYRMTLELGEPVESGWILAAFDDKGSGWLNGKALTEIAFQQPDCPIRFRKFEPANWHVGKNVLAFKVRNDAAKGGLIMRGELTLKSGKVVRIASRPADFLASGKAAENWNQNNFDTTGWQSAMDLGDVNVEPWKSASNVIAFMLTPEEQRNYDAQIEKACNVDFLQEQPDWQAKIVWHNDAAGISVNGTPWPPMIYLVGPNPWVPNVADAVIKAGQSGIRFMEYQTGNGRFFIAPGKYDFSAMDRDVRRVLALNPNAALLIALRFDLTGKWLSENPDEAIGYATGPTDGKGGQIGRFRSPSMASEKFRAEMRAFAAAVTEYMKKQSWFKRVVGVRVSHGVYSEWHYYGMALDMPDTGKAMTMEFRKYLQQKYPDDLALQKAWHDPLVTLDSAKVPDAQKRLGKNRFFRDPSSADRQVLDYYECHGNVVANTLIEFASEIKKGAPKLLVGAYYGYFFCMGYPAEGQTLMLDKVLSSPAVDFLSSPYSYDMDSRRAGGDGQPRMLMSIFKRYGKLAILEADVRTHVTPAREAYSCGRTPEASVAVIRRDIANAWLNGCAIQFLEFDARKGMESWFNDPVIYQAWHDGQRIWQNLFDDEQTVNRDVAVVLSPDEMIRHGYPDERQRPIIETIIDKPLHALNASGSTFDLLSLSDYLSTPQNYRMVIFLNLFSPSEQERTAIKTRIQKAGTSMVWCFAPGLVTDQGFSDAAMSELAEMKLIAKHERLPLAVNLYGASCMKSVRRNTELQENPKIHCADPAATVWGRYAADNLPALAVKRLAEGRTTFFAGMPIIETSVWSAIFAHCGIHRFAGNDVMVLGNERHLLVHVGTGGAYEIRLPRRAKSVKELFSGSILTNDTDTLIVRSSSAASWFLEIIY